LDNSLIRIKDDRSIAALPLPLFDLETKENHIHDNVRGVGLVNAQNSQISGNRIANNLQFGLALFETSSRNHVAENLLTGNGTYGIILTPVLGDASRPGPTGNRITRNTGTGNGAFDLFHSATSTPNVWRDNIYNTKVGADIP
jgi:parallel beta-helix repeat protein